MEKKKSNGFLRGVIVGFFATLVVAGFLFIGIQSNIAVPDSLQGIFGKEVEETADSVSSQVYSKLKYLEQLVEESYPMLQEKKLECIFDKPKTITFLGDGDKLARAFGNLLKNAISYSYANTAIKIEVKEDEDKIQIVFKNKGDKIPEYKLEKIFDKFYRVDESRTSSTGGAGLGLAITKQIIELHHGIIYAENKDEFIAFYIEFPKDTIC